MYESLEAIYFPIDENICPGIPLNRHPGAFNVKRKYDVHEGIDLYCNNNTLVYPMLSGEVLNIGLFTGDKVGSPWWEETYYITIYNKQRNITICYGEIHKPLLKIGENISKSHLISKVKNVLDESKIRKDIPGHSNYMLHLEIYEGKEPDVFSGNLKLKDPTPFVLESMGSSPKFLFF